MSRIALSPREFVSNFALKYPNQGVYTVIPVSNQYLFDLPYHINRLQTSLRFIEEFQQLHSQQQLLSPPPYTSYSEFLQLFKKNVDNNCFDKNIHHGVLTICVARIHDEFIMETVYSSRKSYKLNQPYYEISDCVDVSFVEYQRKIPSIKYCDWTRERKMIEDNSNSAVHEIVMFSKGKTGNFELTEGLISNIIGIDEFGYFITPPVDRILEGSMRRIILACLKNQGSTKDLTPVRGVFSQDGKLVKEFPQSFYTSNKKVMLLRSDLKLVLDPNIPMEVSPLRSLIPYHVWSKL